MKKNKKIKKRIRLIKLKGKLTPLIFYGNYESGAVCFNAKGFIKARKEEKK